MQKTAELLKMQGIAYFIYPAVRKEDFMRATEEARLKIKDIRDVYPFKDSEPNFFLVSCTRSTQKSNEQPPLILYAREGEYTKETQDIFSGRIHDPSD